MVNVGDVIKAQVNDPYGAPIKKGTMLNVTSMGDGLLDCKPWFTAETFAGETWTFLHEGEGAEFVVIDRAPTASTEFNKKRLAYFVRAAEKSEWVRLGPGDVEWLKNLASKL